MSEAQEIFIQVEDTMFKVLPHWFWKEYNQTGWEIETYNTFKKFLTKDTTFVDIGAWLGATVFYAAYIGVNKIYAVEANPLSYELLKTNLEQNELTKDAIVTNVCITDKDNTVVDFGGNNGANTSSASSLRAKDWKVNSTTLLSYLKNNNIINDNLFVKIDIEGAEELLLSDLLELSKHKNITVYLSLHPPFLSDKNDFCDKLMEVCSQYKHIISSSLTMLPLENLKNMILSEEEKPEWGTKFGNFFEFTLANKEFDEGI